MLSTEPIKLAIKVPSGNQVQPSHKKELPTEFQTDNSHLNTAPKGANSMEYTMVRFVMVYESAELRMNNSATNNPIVRPNTQAANGSVNIRGVGGGGGGCM